MNNFIVLTETDGTLVIELNNTNKDIVKIDKLTKQIYSNGWIRFDLIEEVKSYLNKEK